MCGAEPLQKPLGGRHAVCPSVIVENLQAELLSARSGRPLVSRPEASRLRASTEGGLKSAWVFRPASRHTPETTRRVPCSLSFCLNNSHAEFFKHAQRTVPGARDCPQGRFPLLSAATPPSNHRNPSSRTANCQGAATHFPTRRIFSKPSQTHALILPPPSSLMPNRNRQPGTPNIRN